MWRRLTMAIGLAVALHLAPPTAFAQTKQDITERFATSLTRMPTEPLRITGSVYVPAYSSVSLSHGRARADFSVTLSIHNVAVDRPLVLTRVAYFDTAGKLVQSYLAKPVALAPFATVEVFIPVTDIRGGTGANFVVDWAATAPIAEPLIEALMLGGIGNATYSFISRGRPIGRAGPE